MFRGWQLQNPPIGRGIERLEVPENAAGRHPGACVHPKELKQWVETLDGAHPLLACKELRSQLELLVRFPGTLSPLPELIDLLKAPLYMVHTHVNDTMNGPLNEAMSRTAQQELHGYCQVLTEYGQLHKRLVNQLLDTVQGPSAAQLVDVTEVLAWQVRAYTTRYQSSPLEIWQDMLQLYRIAVSLGSTHALAERRGRPTTNLRDLIFGSLLYQLCDALQLSPQKTWQLFSHAVQFADRLELGSVEVCPDGIPVDLSGKVSPYEFARRAMSKPDQGGQRLCVTELIRSLSLLKDDSELTQLIRRDINQLRHAQRAINAFRNR